MEDHPRLSGEYSINDRLMTCNLGSSPLARGVLGPTDLPCSHRRIIPACAGSTRNSYCTDCSNRDHPRLRGEYGMMELEYKDGQGSSPLARGVPKIPDQANCKRRIIPACAGSTTSARSAAFSIEDHPRLRGEYFQLEVYVLLH